MKTRSRIGTEITSPCHRIKNTSRKALQADGRPDGKGFDVKNKTPKLNRRREIKVQTPAKDDILCSQHFDSQTVVGWDCNSPASIKNIAPRKNEDDVEDLVSRLIGEEPEEDVLASRSTPPLLGLWRNRPNNQLTGPSGMHHKLRKRHGRQKRKHHVSDIVLEKLQVALNSCSDGETGGRNGDGELDVPDVNNIDSEQNKDGDALNGSDELFEDFNEGNLIASTAKVPRSDKKRQTPAGKRKITTSKSAEIYDDSGDAAWSDDELFGNDSFIVHATQVSVPVTHKYSSPVIGKKRKSIEKELPKSKCSRYTLPNENKSGTSSRYTCVIAKPVKTSTETNKSSGNPNNAPPVHSLPPSSISAKPPPCVASAVTPSCGADLKSIKSKDFNKNVIQTTSNVPITRAKASSSSTLQGISSYSAFRSVVNSDSNQATGSTNRSGNFKKHNSFSGHYLSKNPPLTTSNRQRSLSGSSHQNTKTSSGNPAANSSNNNPQSFQNRNTYQCSKQTSNCYQSHTKDYNMTSSNTGNDSLPKNSNLQQKSSGGSMWNHSTRSSHVSNNAMKTVPLSTSSGKSKTSLAFTDTCVKKMTTSAAGHEYKTSGGFDTSLTDDLLCQLAEPDDVLDTDMDIKTKPTSVQSSYKPTSCIDNSKNGNVKSGQNQVCSNGDKYVNGKKFTFKSSQKPFVQTSHGKSSNLPAERQTHPDGLSVKSIDKNQKGVPAKLETVPEQSNEKELNKSAQSSQDYGFSEDLFSDEDDLLGSDEGLNEAQIFAMLDEAEFMATQRSCSDKHDKPSTWKCDATNGEGQKTFETKSTTGKVVDHTCGNKQSTANKTYNTKDTDYVTGSQGQPSSQNEISSSQVAKYTTAEIEKKKQMALERRKQRLQASQAQKK